MQFVKRESYVKSPTDKFIKELLVCFYQEAFEYQGYIGDSNIDWYVTERIKETHLDDIDKKRAYKLCQIKLSS